MEKDVANECIEKMLDADGVILASPVYFADVTSQIKALMDRAGMVAIANDGMFRQPHPYPANPPLPSQPYPSITRADSMVTASTGTSSCIPLVPVFTATIASTTSMPSTTLANTA